MLWLGSEFASSRASLKQAESSRCRALWSEEGIWCPLTVPQVTGCVSWVSVGAGAPFEVRCEPRSERFQIPAARWVCPQNSDPQCTPACSICGHNGFLCESSTSPPFSSRAWEKCTRRHRWVPRTPTAQQSPERSIERDSSGGHADLVSSARSTPRRTSQRKFAPHPGTVRDPHASLSPGRAGGCVSRTEDARNLHLHGLSARRSRSHSARARAPPTRLVRRATDTTGFSSV